MALRVLGNLPCARQVAGAKYNTVESQSQSA